MKLNFQKLTVRLRNYSSMCLIASAILMGSSVVMAEEKQDPNTHYFVVTENDSTQVLFPIFDKPVMTLNETSVNINSDSKSYSAEIVNIIDFSFIGYFPDAVTTIYDRINGIEYYGNSIIIKGLTKGDTVSLFDLKGTIIATFMSKEENLAIDLDQVPTGVYILSTKNANYKFKK